MKNNLIRVLLVGDVYGSAGLRCVTRLLPSLIIAESLDFVVLNGENATGGVALSAEDAELLTGAGVDVITGGNHSFEKRDYWPVLESSPAILRPANFPAGTPGAGFNRFKKNGTSFGVLNLMGRENMLPPDCPFQTADEVLAQWEGEGKPDVVIIDFHAESTQEKEALALYLDGRVSVVVGTHTHVQTADERVLPGGTAYMTDLGMTGSVRSVIGVDPVLAIQRNITQVLYKMEPVTTQAALRGLLVDIDPNSGRSVEVLRINLLESEHDIPAQSEA